MSDQPIRVGDKVHVITRRAFPDDLRRHFAGEVTAVVGDLVRVAGYTFVHHSGRNEFDRRPEVRTRLFRLGEAGHIVNVLPSEVDVARLRYVLVDNRLAVTDGAGHVLDINEFGLFG